MDYKGLLEIGLTEGESKIYLALFELGLTTHGPITKESGVSSSKVYPILDKLIDKGLANYIYKGKKKYFSAGDPKKLNEYMQRKKYELEKEERIIQNLIPSLQLKQKNEKEVPSAIVYEGLEGSKTLFSKMIEEITPKEEILIYGVPKKSHIGAHQFFIHWFKIINKKNIKVRIIYTDTARDLAKERHHGQKNVKIRYITGLTPGISSIFKDTIILNVRQKDEPLIAIEIRNHAFAESYRTFFEYLWKNATD